MATRSQQDPTNQASNRTRANKATRRRISNAQQMVLTLWSKLAQPKRTERKKIKNNQTLVFWEYDTTTEELNTFEQVIAIIINGQLETEEEEAQIDWYFILFLIIAISSGAIQENSIIGSLLDEGEAKLSNINLLSQLDDLRASSIDATYKSMKSMSTTLKNQVMQQIKSGMKGGLSKTEIKNLIIERFNVAVSSAKRIADTEINKANNDARLETTKIYRALGVNTAVMHISALLPTTRDHHAARHGNIYTPEQQLQWWETGSNRINCHCSTRPVRVNKQGKIKNIQQQIRIKKQGKDFFKSQ